MSQQHQLPDNSAVKLTKQTSRHRREEDVKEKVRSVYERVPNILKRALDLSSEKGSSVQLTVFPLQELGFNLNKREFLDAINLQYDWPIEDIPTWCVCGDIFSVDHLMLCKKGGFIIQRHNELRDLEADLLSMVCNDVEIEPQLQDMTGEQLSSRSNLAKEARLDIHTRGFWEQHQSAFFDIHVSHPNAESYKQLEPKQIYRLQYTRTKRRAPTQDVRVF